jgi:hypothetical protein
MDRFPVVAERVQRVYGLRLPRHSAVFCALLGSSDAQQRQQLQYLGLSPFGLCDYFADGGLRLIGRDGLDERLHGRYRRDPAEFVTVLSGGVDGLTTDCGMTIRPSCLRLSPITTRAPRARHGLTAARRCWRSCVSKSTGGCPAASRRTGLVSFRRCAATASGEPVESRPAPLLSAAIRSASRRSSIAVRASVSSWVTFRATRSSARGEGQARARAGCAR